MGGFGSGRKCQNRLTTELYRLNVRKLHRWKVLEPMRTHKLRLHRSGGPDALVWLAFPDHQLVADLDLGRDLFGARRTRLRIEVRWSSCPYGGSRPWFLCPGTGCGRLAVILYGKEDFLCRRCRHVTYPMQRVAPHSRALARAQLLRIHLGGTPDMTAPVPPRPKGMHEWTYIKRGIAIYAAEIKANNSLLAAFGPPTSITSSGPSEPGIESLFSDDQIARASRAVRTGAQPTRR